MTVRAYYNEHNAHAAGWLRNLAAAGLIPAGDVDERDIRDVRPSDILGYTAHHFFAGIGIWPLALDLAGWPRDRPVWTGSCPCQPFSQGGKRQGFADERHLWPAWHWLISQHRPDNIFGEQVASKDGLLWLDLVCSDLEAGGYAGGPIDFPSAGVSAPNPRQRLWWVAHTHRDGCDKQRREFGEQKGSRVGRYQPDNRGENGRLAGALRIGHQGPEPTIPAGGGRRSSDTSGAGVRLGDAGDARLPDPEPYAVEKSRWRQEGGTTQQSGAPFHPWREPEWVYCTDDRWRPFEPGSFPLAPRHPGDLGKIRAYGNAINPFAAAEVIRSYLDLEAVNG